MKPIDLQSRNQAETAQTVTGLMDRRMLLVAFWLGLMAAALALRLPNLGKLGFWGDEGYTALAVRAILEHGYPLLPSGGIYPRSWPFLYLEALSAEVFGLNEFALRFPGVVINLGAAWMTYVLGKRLLGNTVGIVAAVMIVFSAWEVEFSRYARMYALFQLLYLTSLYVFYRGFIDGERIYQWLTAPVWLMTLLVHELGIVLAVFLLFPLFIKGYHQANRWMLLSGFFGFGLAGALYLFLEKILRFKDPISETLEASAATVVFNHIAVPPADLFSAVIEGRDSFFYGLMLMAGMGTVKLTQWAISSPQHRSQNFYLILILAACLFHQIGLAFVLLMLFTLLFFEDLQAWRQRPFRVGCSIIFLSAFYWLVYGFYQGLGIRRMISLLFQYPYLYERFLKFFLFDWPVEIALASIGAVLIGTSFIKNRDNRALFAVASFIFPLLFVGFVVRGDDSARYSFHLFPLMLIFGAYGIVCGWKHFLPSSSASVAVTVCIMILVIIPGDLQVAHTKAVSQRSYGDRFDRPHIASSRAYPFYPDYKTTSDYIRSHLSQDDWVVSMREVIPFYYVGRIDYIWSHKDTKLRPGIEVASRVNNVGLQELLADNPGRWFWLLTDPFLVEKYADRARFLDHISDCMVYMGQDGRTAAYLFSSDGKGKTVCSKQDSRISMRGDLSVSPGQRLPLTTISIAQEPRGL